jgi:dTDP-4-dehydrorhamnose 3,5-epimerase-like enzyme
VSVLVDIRPDSPSFKQVEYFLFEPQPESDTQVGLYVPMGVANSIAVIEGPLLYHYAVDAFYDERDPAGDKALSLFDPELDIQWPIERKEMIFSERDRASATLAELLNI